MIDYDFIFKVMKTMNNPKIIFKYSDEIENKADQFRGVLFDLSEILRKQITNAHPTWHYTDVEKEIKKDRRYILVESEIFKLYKLSIPAVIIMEKG